MQTKLAVPALSLVMATLLAACGGGGGDSASPAAAAPTTPATTTPVVTTPAPVLASAQDTYIGTLSDGREHQTIVLENDQFYTMYGRTAGGAFGIEGFLQGNGKSNNGSFSATDVVDSTTTTLRTGATVTATYAPGVSLNGSVVEAGSSVSFTSAPISTAVFNYNATPKLTDLAGSWSLTSLRGTSNIFTVTSTGAFTATSGACTFSGAFVPRASGKNIFDVNMTFGAAPCVLAGQTIKGIAVSYVLTNGKRQLIIAGLDAGRTNSAAFVGVR
ncbi:hypothetical protein [Massilia sp. S19_KUP03_FR1]|uniref:hypothetical protein n=1 Tax=Massilia sp. S19_KUP03_FR1 TaxID=3025503 RepID=UPI002FCCBDE0